jgi:hypothetical protein
MLCYVTVCYNVIPGHTEGRALWLATRGGGERPPGVSTSRGAGRLQRPPGPGPRGPSSAA